MVVKTGEISYDGLRYRYHPYRTPTAVTIMALSVSGLVYSSTPALSTALLIVVLFVCAVLFVVRLQRKPAGFPPGPRGLPIVGNVFDFGQDDAFADTFVHYSKKYGPVFSIKIGFSNDVVVSGPEMIKTLLVKKGLDFADKPHLVEADLYNKERRGIFVSHCDEGWATQRKFAHSTLRGMGFGKVALEPIIREEVEDTIKQFKSYAGKPFDPQETLATNASNIICRLTFGHRFQHNDPEFHQMMMYLRGIMGFRAEEEVMVFPFLRHLYSRKKRWQRHRESNRKFQEYFGRKIQEHRARMARVSDAADPEVHDFIDAYLLHARDDPGHFTDDELKVVLCDLFVAGSDTVSTTLSWAILYMAAYQDIQAKVRAEISEVVGEQSISLSHRGAMPYTEATLIELQRLASVIPINPHAAYTDSELGGYRIPKGTRIWINMWSLFHDPAEWPNPKKCDPTRFLNKDGTKVVHKESFMPFSAGRRVCMGELLAKMELFLFFANLMKHFRFEFAHANFRPSFEGVVGLNRQPKPFQVRAIPVIGQSQTT